jgi:hypothetical protein
MIRPRSSTRGTVWMPRNQFLFGFKPLKNKEFLVSGRGIQSPDRSMISLGPRLGSSAGSPKVTPSKCWLPVDSSVVAAAQCRGGCPNPRQILPAVPAFYRGQGVKLAGAGGRGTRSRKFDLAGPGTTRLRIVCLQQFSRKRGCAAAARGAARFSVALQPFVQDPPPYPPR